MRHFASFLIFIFISFVSCHPVSTLTAQITQINGSLPAPVFYAGQLSRIPFVIRDKWNNNALVSSANLVSMHGRVIHVIMVSEDLETIFHVHADDYGSLATMSANGAFYVDLVLPKSGLWSFGAYFVYKNGDDLREGSGSDYVSVRPSGLAPSNPPLYDFANTTKKFAQYPFTEVFNDFVDIRNNTDPLGYTVSMTIGTGNGVSAPDNVTAGCQPVIFKILDKTGAPARNLVPYLDAAAHIIFAAEYDTLYHGHAMYLASYLNFDDDVVAMIRSMNMSAEDMKNMPMSSMLRLMMGAMMIGVMSDGSLSCVNDQAQMMEEMGMDFNEFYGPPGTFGSDLITLFDFPQQGNWRIFVSFAVLEGNSTYLVVADFSAKVPRTPTFTYTIPLPPTRTVTVGSPSVQENVPSVGTTLLFSTFVLLILLLVVL